MKSNNTYRNNGATGALLDEYERSIDHLIDLINTIPDDQLIIVVDHNTNDDDCRSIQSILTHVVRAGYGYAVAIQNYLGEHIPYRKSENFKNIDQYTNALRKMFAYTEKVFADNPNLTLEENDPDKKIKVRWGQLYDVEQLMEHAIVHILRHRRQIERFLLKLKK